MRVVRTLEPAKVAEFRRDLDAMTAQFFEPTENVLRQDDLRTRVTKS